MRNRESETCSFSCHEDNLGKTQEVQEASNENYFTKVKATYSIFLYIYYQ